MASTVGSVACNSLDVVQQAEEVPALSARSIAHKERPRRALALFTFLLLPVVACSSNSSSAPSGSASAGPTPGAGSSNGLPPAGAGGGSGSSQVTAGNGGVLVDNGLPGRALVRRLSNTEYDATIVSLLGDKTGYAAAFPTETVVNGFNNNTDVQDVAPALAEQYMVVSEQIAANATKDTDKLLGCKLSAGETCINDFITRFGLRAWRRPITTEEQTDLLSVYRAGADSVSGVRLLLEAFLVSPSFLYRAEVGVPVAGQTYRALTSWEIASRLSYFLTGTMPDDKLLATAQADGLSTADGIAAEAKRILTTPAARARVAEFFAGWLDLRAVDRLQRDAAQFPKWDSQLPALFASESKTFATQVVFDGAGDLSTLLTAPFTYGDPSLASYYGGTVSSMQNGVARIELPPTQRAGLLTQAAFLSTHSKEIATDPVSRGKFVRERIFCQGLPPPPADLVIAAPQITPGTTTRERFKQHESEPLCAGCHKLIDPVGLVFENFDAIGQWREQEQGQPIDVSGDLTNTDVTGAIVGVVPMTAKLAQSQQVETCFVRQWFRFAFGRAEGDADDPRIHTIALGFEGAKGKVQDLLIALTITPDFRYLAAETK